MRNEKLTPWRRFMRLLAMERKDLLQVLYYAIFSGLVALSLPLGIQAIVNLIQGAEISTSWIILVALVTLGVIFAGILNLMQLRIIETIQQRIFTKSSFELSFRFPKYRMEFLRDQYPPELANRFFDTLIIQKGLSKILLDVPAALLQIIFSLLLLSFYHPFFIVFGALLLISIYLAFQYSARRGLETSLEESRHKYRVAHWIQEVARSIASFKLSGETTLAVSKNDSLVSNYLDSRESHFSIIKLQYIKMIGFKALITAGFLIIGGMLVLNQEMNIGQFIAAEIVIIYVINSMEKLILGLETLYDILTSIEKLGEVVDKPLEPQEGQKLNYEEGINIELENVSYSVENRDKPILKDINLDINPGSRIIIEGDSGAGKSSLLRVISGLNTSIHGNMYINGLSFKGIHINHYRAQLGLSISEEFPFESTLKENLTFGDESISEDRIFEVLHALKLTSFIKELPLGLNSTLFPEGRQISYTNSKKIVLARAVLKNPKLLILENALDQMSDKEAKSIIDFLCRPDQPWSLVVVSKIDYWKNYCNKFIYLKNGSINSKK